jgi:putative FmdB family regulatory protein
MPIYEYHCNACGHNFEYLVMGGNEPDQCPECRADAVCRLMSTCGFISKGSGGETVGSNRHHPRHAPVAAHPVAPGCGH